MVAATGRGNNLDSVRKHNLSAVLTLVHRQGPSSRSELTRATGLNRSTVGALVGELADLRLVRESDPDPNNRVGRPSPVVEADARVVVYAVNPEIDAVTVGVVGLDGGVKRRIRAATGHIPTAQEAAETAAAVIDDLGRELGPGVEPIGIGVAVPGLVREADGLVRLAPHLQWLDEPFGDYLREETGMPVSVANDAHLGANAELLFGSGRGVADLVYLNGGASGIGGGIVTGGSPLSGRAGYAGEWGHTLVNSAGRACHCGATGCLETEVSQAGLLVALAFDADRLERTEDLDLAVAVSNNPAVGHEVERQLAFLAVAVRNAVNAINPQLVVLGGFLGALHAARPGMLDEMVSSTALGASVEDLRIVRAALGTNLLMVGAAELALQPLLADPAEHSHAFSSSASLSRSRQ